MSRNLDECEYKIGQPSQQMQQVIADIKGWKKHPTHGHLIKIVNMRSNIPKAKKALTPEQVYAIREARELEEKKKLPKHLRHLLNTQNITKLEQMYIAQWARCYYCEKTCNIIEGNRDHVVPKSRGGSGGRKNSVFSCIQCNAQKKSMSEADFRKMKGFPEKSSVYERPINGQ